MKLMKVHKLKLNTKNVNNDPYFPPYVWLRSMQLQDAFSVPLLSVSNCCPAQCLTPRSILFSSTATAVRIIWSRAHPVGSAPVRRVRRGLCWLLPGQRPLLRLGRQVLLPLLCLAEEVSADSMSDANFITNWLTRLGVLRDARIRLPGWLNGCFNGLVMCFSSIFVLVFGLSVVNRRLINRIHMVL